jgi:hypothetical protein
MDIVTYVKLETKVHEMGTVEMLGVDGTETPVDVPWYNKKGEVNKYYYWLAAQLDYEITVRMVSAFL